MLNRQLHLQILFLIKRLHYWLCVLIQTLATKEVFVFSFFFTFQSRALLNIAYMSVVSHRDPPSKVFHLYQTVWPSDCWRTPSPLGLSFLDKKSKCVNNQNNKHWRSNKWLVQLWPAPALAPSTSTTPCSLPSARWVRTVCKYIYTNIFWYSVLY